MPRLLWLCYERPPHADAVSYPAGEEDARLVLELLASSYLRRLQLAGQFRSYLKEQAALPLFRRQWVPCRRPSTALYHPVPWRLAKWLSTVLSAPEGTIDRTATRIRSWLESSGEPQIVNPAS